MVGWIASVAIVAGGLAGATTATRSVLVAGWVLLLGALGAAFVAQSKLGRSLPGDAQKVDGGGFGVAALWLLIAGLAATARSATLNEPRTGHKSQGHPKRQLCLCLVTSVTSPSLNRVIAFWEQHTW